MSSERFIEALHEAQRTNELEDFLDARHTQLCSETRAINLAGGGHRLTFNYIHPDSVVRIGPRTRGFKMNDPDIYRILASTLLRFDPNTIDDADMTILQGSQISLLRYFNQVVHQKDFERKTLHERGRIWKRNHPLDLVDIRASGTSMCLENAATSHNLSIFGGVSSALVYCTMRSGENGGEHCVQIINSGGSIKLFDPTHPNYEVSDRGDIAIGLTCFDLDPAEFLLQSVPIRRTICRPDSLESYPVEWSFMPSFPATQEEFSGMSRLEWMVYGEASEANMRSLAIQSLREALMDNGLL